MPAWQLRVSAVLLQLAADVDPANRRLQARWERLGRLGVFAVLGFLLLVPVQLVATARSLTSLDSAPRNRQQRVEANLNRMLQEIRAASSHAALQRRIRDIQTPDLVIDAASLDQSEQQNPVNPLSRRRAGMHLDSIRQLNDFRVVLTRESVRHFLLATAQAAGFHGLARC